MIKKVAGKIILVLLLSIFCFRSWDSTSTPPNQCNDFSIRTHAPIENGNVSVYSSGDNDKDHTTY